MRKQMDDLESVDKHIRSCLGCMRKNVKIVTTKNAMKQALCSRCNNKLIRKFGKNYAKFVADPAAAVKEIEDAAQEKKDRQESRKMLFTILGLIEKFDMQAEEESLVFKGFRHVLGGLPEATGYLTFDTPDEKCEIPEVTEAAARRILNVGPGALAEEIKIEYNRMVQMYHPDNVAGLLLNSRLWRTKRRKRQMRRMNF